MIFRIALFTLAISVSGLLGQTSPKNPKKKDDTPAGYKKDNLRGFTLYFSDEVLKQDRDSKQERKPLEALERELIIVENVLPPDKVKNLKAVPIWVEWDEQIAMRNGRGGTALAVFYGGHQSNLLGGKSNPMKANAVTILSLKSLTAEHQPKTDSGRCVTLHELAHAFHWHVVGSDPLVETTFRQAMERKLYDPALYAATNEREYFAELTCAYLDRLDYFPRNRDELKKHDPKGFELMVKVWGRVPERKVAADPKTPKLPSADGGGQFALNFTTEGIRLGDKLVGELPPISAWKGRPVLIVMFPATSGRARSVLPKINDWQLEFQDFGLITIGAETSRVAQEDAARIMRQAGLNFPLISEVRLPVNEEFRLPHAVLFDHAGKCVFRGAALDAEQYVRIAIGKSLVARLGKESFSKNAQKVIDQLDVGAPMTKVFAALELEKKNAPKNSDLTSLESELVRGGTKAMEVATELAKTDPIAAFFESERLPVVYRGTSLERPAFLFVNKLKGNPKIERELRARAALVAVKKVDTLLSGRDMSFDPQSPAFKENNSLALKQLGDEIERVRKNYSNTRAVDEALRIAERWDVKVK